MTTGNVPSSFAFGRARPEAQGNSANSIPDPKGAKFLLDAWDNYSAEHAKLTQAKCPSHVQCGSIG